MTVQVKDLHFEPFISHHSIQARVVELANRLTVDYHGKNPVFLSVLNGSFMFTSDLMKSFLAPCEISFIKLASYEGTESSGDVKTLIGINSNIANRHVIIIEDIVDTGTTVKKILEMVWQHKPASVKIMTLLFKPEAFKENMEIDYVGFEIDNKFVVGYGLDYDGFGRNMNQIYVVK
ncbi:MAG: hypoxanthine phosphoribosyltransferase [Bacteroidia bacterium]